MNFCSWISINEHLICPQLLFIPGLIVLLASKRKLTILLQLQQNTANSWDFYQHRAWKPIGVENVLSGSKSQTSDHVGPSSQSPNCGIWISKHNLSWVSYPYLPPHATICSTFGSTTVILSFPNTESLMLLWLPDTNLFLLLLCNHNVVALMKYSVNVWYARFLICKPQNVENCWSRMFQVLILDTFHDLWYFIRVQFSRSHPPWLPDWSLGLWMLQGLLTPASHQKAYITLQILSRQQCQPRQFKSTLSICPTS